MKREHEKHGVKGWKHESMAEHEGGHMGHGDFDMKEMHEANEPKNHKGGMTIISHQDHQEGHMVHKIHHFGAHGEGKKS